MSSASPTLVTPRSYRHVSRLVMCGVASLSLALAACGNKGPLYLEPEESPPITLPEQEPLSELEAPAATTSVDDDLDEQRRDRKTREQQNGQDATGEQTEENQTDAAR